MEDMKPTVDFSLNTTQSPPRLSGSAGNPRLNPFRADALDVSFEKYFGNKGYFSVAGFYKDLKTYILKSPNLSFDFGPYVTPSTTLPPSGSTIGTLTTPVNGSGGHISGFEVAVNVPFSLMTQYLDGFGAIVNFSNTDSSVKLPISGLSTSGITSITIPLPGLSKQVTNLRLYYEKHGFQIALAQRHRSDFLGNVSDFQDNQQLVFIKGETVRDLQASYEFRSGPIKGLTLLAQANNLTNAVFNQFDPATGNTTKQQTFGKSYLFGFNYKL
jgi:iron complex outermembrane receptor protein